MLLAVSKKKLKNWYWLEDPKEFLHQDELIEDYLEQYMSLIAKPKKFFDEMLTIGAVIHYVPLKQLKKENILLIFYEELCIDPDNVLKRLIKYLYGSIDESISYQFKSRVNIPSRVTYKNSAVVKGNNLIDGWRNELSNS